MAGQGTVSIKAHNDPLPFETIAAATIAAAAGGPVAIPDNTKVAYMQVEGGNVKYRDDGTDPTAVIGSLLQDGQVLEYTGNLNAIKFIKASGTPKMNISYYK